MLQNKALLCYNNNNKNKISAITLQNKRKLYAIKKWRCGLIESSGKQDTWWFIFPEMEILLEFEGSGRLLMIL